MSKYVLFLGKDYKELLQPICNKQKSLRGYNKIKQSFNKT